MSLRTEPIPDVPEEAARVAHAAFPKLKAAKDLAPAGERFDSPYDSEACCGNKRATERGGCKAHFAERCDEDCQFLICNVETTKTTIFDLLMSLAINDSLRRKKLLRALHMLNTGLHRSRKEKHELIQECRKMEDTAEWGELYRQRARIEGTFSQPVKAFKFRRSRYIDEQKKYLNIAATALTINIGRSAAFCYLVITMVLEGNGKIGAKIIRWCNNFQQIIEIRKFNSFYLLL